MGLIEKDVEDVEAKIRLWTPCWYETEREYEDALYRHLNASFKDKFERQWSHGRTRADLYVEFKDAAKVAIEIKRDLQDRSEYHRLLGQLWEYVTEWKVEALIVLCGENDPALVKNVENFVRFLGSNQPTSGFNKKVRFVDFACAKPISAPAQPPTSLPA